MTSQTAITATLLSLAAGVLSEWLYWRLISLRGESGAAGRERRVAAWLSVAVVGLVAALSFPAPLWERVVAPVLVAGFYALARWKMDLVSVLGGRRLTAGQASGAPWDVMEVISDYPGIWRGVLIVFASQIGITIAIVITGAVLFPEVRGTALALLVVAVPVFVLLIHQLLRPK